MLADYYKINMLEAFKVTWSITWRSLFFAIGLGIILMGVFFVSMLISGLIAWGTGTLSNLEALLALRKSFFADYPIIEGILNFALGLFVTFNCLKSVVQHVHFKGFKFSEMIKPATIFKVTVIHTILISLIDAGIIVYSFFYSPSLMQQWYSIVGISLLNYSLASCYYMFIINKGVGSIHLPTIKSEHDPALPYEHA